MNRLIGITSILVALAAGASAGSRQNMEQFLWGVYALQESHGLSDAQRAAYFQSLCAITGVSVERARHFVNQYRNRPADWQKVLDAIGKVPSIVEPQAPPPPPALSRPPRSRDIGTDTHVQRKGITYEQRTP